MSFVEGELDGYRGDDFYVESKPLKKGGSSFKTKEIIFTNGYAHTEPSKAAKIFQWGFFFAGDAMIFLGVYLYFYQNQKDALISLLIIGSIFSLIGFLMMRFTKKICFDKSTNVYHRGKGYDHMLTEPDYKVQGKLGDIKNIQIIKERVKTDKSSFYSYEINLVLKSGERLNVVDHGNLKEITSQAKELETFLGKSILKNDILVHEEGWK